MSIEYVIFSLFLAAFATIFYVFAVRKYTYTPTEKPRPTPMPRMRAPERWDEPALDLTETGKKNIVFTLPRTSAEIIWDIFNHAADCAIQNRDFKRAAIARCLAGWMEMRIKTANDGNSQP